MSNDEQAQSAERAAHPLHVATTDPGIEARAQAAYEAWSDAEGAPCGGRWQAVVRAVDASRPDPEHARVTMTPLDRLRVIAGLVQTLPCDRPELWCALPVDIVATLPGAEVDVQPRKDEPGKVLHVARATVAGLRVVALETRDAKDGEGVST